VRFKGRQHVIADQLSWSAISGRLFGYSRAQACRPRQSAAVRRIDITDPFQDADKQDADKEDVGATSAPVCGASM